MRGLFYTILLFCALLTSCCGERTALEVEAVYTPHYAKGFSVVRDKVSDEVLLCITNPWQGARDVTLYHSLSRPSQRIVAMSSSYVAMIDAIGCAERIVGVSGAKFISTQSISNRIESGATADIGFDGAFDFELVKAMQADLVLLYGVSGEVKGVSNKLDELGIPYIYIGEYLEDEPLGRAEWLVAMGYLCGKVAESKELFEEIEQRYLAIRNQAHTSTYRPRVMLNTPYRDTWFMPSTKSYMVRLIEDANGEYIYKANHSDSTRPISLEEALLLAERADFWLNVGQHRTLKELRAATPHFNNVAAVRHCRIYNNTRRTTQNGGSDFWESGTIRPDVILADLVKILHHEAASEELYYYERLE